jgi:adenylate cyclase
LQGAVAYAVAGWLAIQVAVTFKGALDLPARIDSWVTIAVIAGFPVAVVLAWLFDFSLAGVRLTAPEVSTALPDKSPLPALPNTPAAKHSIAVLPFSDMSAERDQAYLGDGVAEEILNALVKVTPLKVSGRTSSFSLKGRDLTVSEIGAALNVAYVLEGSVRKQGDKVRITAQLIQASDGFHVWSESYDGNITDIFDLQDNIARSIVGELEVVLDVDQIRLVARMTKSPEAYDAFLQGRKLAQVQEGEGVLARAVAHLEEACGSIRSSPSRGRGSPTPISICRSTTTFPTGSRIWRPARRRPIMPTSSIRTFRTQTSRSVMRV